MLGSYSIGHAQGKSEQELLKAGNKLFYEENYAGATTYFLQLLSLNQTNAEYNYKYGTCVLHSDGDKNKALKYLLFAAAKPTGLDKEVNYWAARALHLNYRFAEAVKYYQKYAATAGEKEKEKFQVTHQIEMCNNGKRLLRNVTDIVVNSKKDFREADFYALYDKKSVPGKILVVEKLQSSIDKKKEHRIVVNLPRTSDVVYFSSYGDDGKSLDIYRVKRLPGDSWSKPQIVKGSVNTAFDENYPYMHPDGRTLYFCSKGHNSMGGYDIFKSNFDPETETFGQPENMDFAINTPDDDILYILDSLEQSAWFASKRESGFGKVHVYNVKVERYPVLIAILKGRFVNEVTPGKNGVTITVENIVTNEAEGLFNSKSTTGDYLITLDKSGKYRYKVKVEGTDKVYEALVDVPYQKELRPLKQEIALVTKEGTPTLVIRNMFNEEIEGAEDIIAEVLANKASLDPNADKFTNQESVSKGKDSVVDAAISENLTNEDLIKMAKEQADAQKKEADELKEKLEAAYSVAAQKTEEARTKSKDAENNIASGDDIIDPLEKGMLYDQAKKDNEDANKAANEAVIALNLAKNLEKQADKAKKDADVAANYAKGIEEAINSKNKEEAIKKLKEQQAYIKSLMSANAQQDDLYAETKKKAAEKRNEANKALDAANKLKEQENAITADINSLKREEEKAKGDKLKKIQDDIKSLQEDLANATEKKKEAFRKSDALIKEADQIDDQAELLANILENTSGNTKVLTQAEKDAIAGNTQSVSKNIAGNNDKIEQKVQVDRTKKFDYNDFLAKYDYYANMFNEYERLKKSLFTAEDYDRLINHNKNWITDINNDIANTEAAANSTDDPEKKKALSAKKSQLQQLKVTKEQENKDLEVEKQKLLARLAKNNNTDNEVKNLNDPNLNKSLADNDNALKAIDNSNKSDDQKAIEKNKTNNLYIDDLNKQIEKDKKQLAITTDEEQKKKLREKILVEENVKRKKESEIEANENALKNKGFNEELTNTVTDKVKDNSELTNSAEVTKQVKKTNVLKEEINQLEIKKANSKDETEKSNIDKQIDKKKLALYQEEEKLAEAIKTENDKNFNQKDSQLDEKLDKTLIKDENKNIAKNLSVAAENDKKEADKLFQEAKTEQDPTKRNEKFEAAIEKQNDAIRKQNDALTVIDANDTKYLASNDPTNTNGTNNTNGNNGNNGTTNDNNGTNANNGTNNDNNGTNGNNGTTNDNNGSTNNNVAENTYNVDPGNYSDPNAKKELDAVKTTLDKIEQKQSEINNLKAQANKETDPAKKQDLEKRIAEKEKELAKDELAVAKTFEKINSTEIAKNRESVNQLIAKVDPDKLNDQQKTTFNNAKDLFTQSANDAAKADALRIKANDETDPTKKNNYLKEANELEKSAIQKQKEAEKLLNT
ncbi:MAG TPA: hypothetical protein VK177_13155, partial [Flavobacteriales bacterium]|nr:hypothetical protein [Flavobacteriales bacterium]